MRARTAAESVLAAPCKCNHRCFCAVVVYFGICITVQAPVLDTHH
jgi:hypothetical protein